MEGMDELARSIERAPTVNEDIFNLVIGFFKKYTVGPTLDELCRMIDIMHYKKKGTTSKGHINPIIIELTKQGYFEPQKLRKGQRRVAGRIIVIGARWEYTGPEYHEKNAREIKNSDKWAESYLLGTKKDIRDGRGGK